jgi:two-component system copper resistance phosphate regulon response regulator CusR
MDRSILIIEDELESAQFVIAGLEEEGFRVEHAVDGERGREMLQGRTWDLALLDWSLPHQDGLCRLRGSRQAGLQAPVIFLTARDEVEDRVRGLDGGG